ncbi:MAG: hypothetical protein R3B89_13020 [Polyangiaceae bacterium]
MPARRPGDGGLRQLRDTLAQLRERLSLGYLERLWERGALRAGHHAAGACDSCSEQVCQNDCSWGGCELKVGNECDWNMGHHWRCCGVDSWQFCLSSCKWSTACETNLTNADCCSGPGPSC